MNFRYRMLALTALIAFSFCHAQTRSKTPSVPALRWELVGNDKLKPGQNVCAFTLVNRSKQNFPAKGWTIYFSSSRDADPAVLSTQLIVEHVNGDIFKLVPAADFKGLKPGDSVRAEYASGGLLLNYTNSPAGPYIVFDAMPDKGFTITNYSKKKLVNTTSGLVTPSRIWKQNASILEMQDGDFPPVFPTPFLYFKRSGFFPLSANTVIVTSDSFRNAAAFFAAEMSAVFGKPLEVNPAATTGNKITVRYRAAINPERYDMEMNENEVVIYAVSDAAAFYGFQSLRSLFPVSTWQGIQTKVEVPCYQFEDQPRFAYRSLMLDAARNFHSKEEILKILDLMALYKMNVFHFHFIDDEGWRLEIPGLPELTAVGAKRGYPLDSKKFLPTSYASGPEPGKNAGSGYYTRDEFITILRYANARHISVIPEVETPGHGRAAIKAMDARYRKYMQAGDPQEALRYLLRDTADHSVYSSAQQWTDNVMCVALPSVYRFIEKVTDEIQAMYREAGAPLSTIHFGGDEVPAGVWEGSPACQALLRSDKSLKNVDDLWYYYYGKVNQILKQRGLFLSAWEEAGLRKTMLDGEKKMIPNPGLVNEHFQLHVWNNMVGWGAEDLPYRLANAGYKVVLSPVSNNYLDMAYSKSPDEPGYYWGGFVDVDKPFYFIPYDYYKNTVEDAAGGPVRKDNFTGKDRLTDYGRSNIVGIQGLLWSENLRTDDQLEYLLLPKLLGIAERAWAPDPKWAATNDTAQYKELYQMAWSQFVNRVSKKELPVLAAYKGGFLYRIPPPGVIAQNGMLIANTQLPGLIIRYTTDGTEPGPQSPVYQAPVPDNGKVLFRCFDNNGRGGRSSAKDQ